MSNYYFILTEAGNLFTITFTNIHADVVSSDLFGCKVKMSKTTSSHSLNTFHVFVLKTEYKSTFLGDFGQYFLIFPKYQEIKSSYTHTVILINFLFWYPKVFLKELNTCFLFLDVSDPWP